MKKIQLAVFDMEGTLFKRSCRFDFIKEDFPENWRKLCLCHGEEVLQAKPFISAWSFLCNLIGPEVDKKNQVNWQKWREGAYTSYDEVKKQFPQKWENLCLVIGAKALEEKQF